MVSKGMLKSTVVAVVVATCALGMGLVPADAAVDPSPAVGAAAASGPVTVDISGCTQRSFSYRSTTTGARLWSGSFRNTCKSYSFYIRADLANGPDPADRIVAPGQTVTWSNDPVTGSGTTFRAWKACRYARCA